MKIINDNCFEVIKTFEDKSIDFILTDPPYLYTDIGGKGSNDFSKRALCNQGLDFISNGFEHEILFAEFERVLKKINICIFCSSKQIPSIMSYWEEKGYSTTLLVWVKPNPIPLLNSRYISNIEFIIYIRGKDVTFNITGYSNQLRTFNYAPPNNKYRFHIAEKPVALLERLINTHTNKNDLVLDCFAGSFSTGIACKNTDRDFIGIEIEESYFNLGKKRMDKYIPQNKLI